MFKALITIFTGLALVSPGWFAAAVVYSMKVAEDHMPRITWWPDGYTGEQAAELMLQCVNNRRSYRATEIDKFGNIVTECRCWPNGYWVEYPDDRRIAVTDGITCNSLISRREECAEFSAFERSR